MSEEFTNVDREFDWDDEINNEDGGFEVLPEGDYKFTVTKIERGRSKGSDKMPASNMAIITLKVFGSNGKSVTVQDNIVLHSKLEWKLCQFFRSIGLKKHNEPMRMRWNEVVGTSGRLKLYVDTWVGNDGKDRESNKVDKYYDPDDTPEAPAVGDNKYW